MRVEPIFYPNLEDETHCLQVCIQMALHSLNPPIHLDIVQIDDITGFKVGKAT